MRHYGLLHKISNYLKQNERYKPTRGRKKVKMLYDLANDSYIALKRAAADREYCRPTHKPPT